MRGGLEEEKIMISGCGERKFYWCVMRDAYCDSVGMTAVVMEGAEESWMESRSRSEDSHRRGVWYGQL